MKLTVREKEIDFSKSQKSCNLLRDGICGNCDSEDVILNVDYYCDDSGGSNWDVTVECNNCGYFEIIASRDC
jgi:hypothetical protein